MRERTELSVQRSSCPECRELTSRFLLVPVVFALRQFQLYDSALVSAAIECIWNSGKQLVQSGRLANLLQSCRSLAATTCTSRAASNRGTAGADMIQFDSISTADDGSCVFEEWDGTAEQGLTEVTGDWQRIELAGSFEMPVVFWSLLTRSSTTIAVVRIRHLQADVSGRWSFEISAEQKQCHHAVPPPLAERTSFLVVEAGVSSQGWQAGVVRVRDQSWHRVSFYRPFEPSMPVVVLAQPQGHESRLSLVTAHLHISPLPSPQGMAPHFSAFLRLNGDGIWCPDGQYYSSYFRSLDLSGNALAVCEPAVPQWHWHVCCGGVPPILNDNIVEQPYLFSSRWSTRLMVERSAHIIFSSLASGGSRVILDNTIVLDAWDISDSTFSSEPVSVGMGRIHIVSFEYRSAFTDAVPTDSYAVFSWTGDEDSHSNTTSTSTMDPSDLYLDLGWWAFKAGTGALHGVRYEAGYIEPLEDRLFGIVFNSSFDAPPSIFAGYVSLNTVMGGNLRVVESDEERAVGSIEYDTCGTLTEVPSELVSWVAIGTVGSDVRVHERLTLASDVHALLAVASEAGLPPYLRWLPNSDPCRDRWSGVECRSAGGGQPRVVVVDIHQVDLTGASIPWEAIAELDMLTELSLWNLGMGGEISGAALCGLTALGVIALSDNVITGTFPDCSSRLLQLDWLWLNNNRIHGPISEFENLGVFLKDINSLNLDSNRWAPLEPAEKICLETLAAPIGIDAIVTGDHDWDFTHSWEWESSAPGTIVESINTERDVSHRMWTAGMSSPPLVVQLSFDFPTGETFASSIVISADGTFGVTDLVDSVLEESLMNTFVTGYSADCADHGLYAITDSQLCQDMAQRRGASQRRCSSPSDAAPLCDARPIIIETSRISEGCFVHNKICYDANCLLHDDSCGQICESASPAFKIYYNLPDYRFILQQHENLGTTADYWTNLAALVPGAHQLGDNRAEGISSQGAEYFSDRFCSGWSKFVHADSCIGAAEDCDAAGNAVFDGGDDMYDIGNVLFTSLMGSCAEDPYGCPLGSLRYRSDFEPVETGCFGAGGSYRMAQLANMWIFLSHNGGETPLTFEVVGNLGSDGSGAVTEFIFEAAPFVGFVKRECGGGDPSVNHMIVVDSTGGLPTHSCDFARGGECTGASSDIDDDIVTGIPLGSPILFLLFGSEDGYCVKQDEYRLLFDAAVRCLWLSDPLTAIHNLPDQPLLTVDVDDRGEIVYSGTSSTTGWKRGGGPSVVAGPASDTRNALQFSSGRWLQLEPRLPMGEAWTFDFYCHIQGGTVDAGTLLAFESAGGEMSQLSSSDIFRDLPVATSTAEGWHQVTVQHVGASYGQGCTRKVFKNIEGTTVEDLTTSASYPDFPDIVEQLNDMLEAPTDRRDNFGQSIVCYFRPPTDGLYTFVIESDDNSVLEIGTGDGANTQDDDTAAMTVAMGFGLSVTGCSQLTAYCTDATYGVVTRSVCPITCHSVVTDAAGSTMTTIASVSGHTDSRQWDKYPSQTSAPVQLTGGSYYYLRALAKDGDGADNLAVGVTLPDGTDLRPIPIQDYLFKHRGASSIDARSTVFIDGVARSTYHVDANIANVVSVGANSAGEDAFPFRIVHLGIYPGLISPNTTHSTNKRLITPLPYHEQNQKWVEISRGMDGVDIMFDTIGWDKSTHEQVKVILDPAGSISITTNRSSSLRDHALASAGDIADRDRAAAANQSSPNATGALGVKVRLKASDPVSQRSLASLCLPL